MTPLRTLRTPRESDLGLGLVGNQSGLSASVLPNGCLFAITHRHERGQTLINQVQGSPLDGGIGRLLLRLGAEIVEAVGGGAGVELGAGKDRFTWEGAARGLRHGVTLWLHPRDNLWLWRVRVANAGAEPVSCDAILVQDVGLGARGFVMSNEAYASQYIDHHAARHTTCGWVVMSRQNLAQGGGDRRQLHARSVRTSGRRRTRLPVAAKMALQTAGGSGGIAGSPRPVGGLSLSMKWISIFGEALMRRSG